jgi:hypothetical protein
MQKPFSLFTRRDDGSLHFVEATETFETAKDRAMAFSKLWPREYIIFNEMTGLKFFFDLSFAKMQIRLNKQCGEACNIVTRAKIQGRGVLAKDRLR